jgi:hypothetical protein
LSVDPYAHFVCLIMSRKSSSISTLQDAFTKIVVPAFDMARLLSFLG